MTSVSICLQGGGSATAWQAGALLPFIENPYIHINGITGTSGGAFNGAILKHVFARHGQTIEGKIRASQRLRSAWEDHIAINDYHATTLSYINTAYIMQKSSVQIMAIMHSKQMKSIVSRYHDTTESIGRKYFTAQLEKTLYKLLPDETALQSAHGPALSIQTVDEKTNKGTLWTGKNITREAIMGSASLKDIFHSSNGQIDGAYLGGANPPSPTQKIMNRSDVVIYFMTSARPNNVTPKLQSELTANELGEDQIITDHAYCEIDMLKQRGYTVEVVSPAQSFSKAEKGETAISTITGRIDSGRAIGQDRLEDILYTYAPKKLLA